MPSRLLLVRGRGWGLSWVWLVGIVKGRDRETEGLDTWEGICRSHCKYGNYDSVVFGGRELEREGIALNRYLIKCEKEKDTGFRGVRRYGPFIVCS